MGELGRGVLFSLPMSWLYFNNKYVFLKILKTKHWEHDKYLHSHQPELTNLVSAVFALHVCMCLCMCVCACVSKLLKKYCQSSRGPCTYTCITHPVYSTGFMMYINGTILHVSYYEQLFLDVSFCTHIYLIFHFKFYVLLHLMNILHSPPDSFWGKSLGKFPKSLTKLEWKYVQKMWERDRETDRHRPVRLFHIHFEADYRPL